LALANDNGTYRWALERVIDTHGNTLTYRHSCDGSECYLALISYADAQTKCDPHEEKRLADALGARVILHYEPRPDPVSYGTGGDLAVTSKRLKTVEVRMAGKLVRAYALAYETSRSTGSSVLRPVQTFPGVATVNSSGTVTPGATQPQPATVFSTASMTGAPGRLVNRDGPDGRPAVDRRDGTGRPVIRPGLRRVQRAEPRGH
jgi:hypothetical protein